MLHLPRFACVTRIPCLNGARQSAQLFRCASTSTVSGQTISVVSKYAASRIDIAAARKALLDVWSDKSPQSHLDKDWVIFTFPHSDFHQNAAQDPVSMHVSLSRRGSVVVVNADAYNPSHDVQSVLKDGRIATPVVDKEYSATEDCKVQVDPQSSEWSRFEKGRLILQQLDLDNVRILNSVMAQTVNLQYFEAQVDKMYEIVVDLNSGFESQGGVGHNTSYLYKHLALTNNITNAVMLSGLRNTTRPGSTAWKEEKYSQLQEELWEEYDLEERYEEIVRKLNYITETIKFNLEVIKDNKSIMLERLIVVLITAELMMSALHAGWFRGISSFALKVVNSIIS